MQVRNRDIWVDAVKVVACVFVALGHFYMSMVSAELLSDNGLYRWFIQTIYYFHVPLFFICSGFLYQKYTRVDSVITWWKNIRRKLISLGIPYVVFSTVTWILKTVFSGATNSDVLDSLLTCLVAIPLSPYWYLYALLFLFLVTPTSKSKKHAMILCGTGLLLKVLSLFWAIDIYPISKILENEVWFVLGMGLCWIPWLKIPHKLWIGSGGVLVFGTLSIAVYCWTTTGEAVGWLMGMLGCASVILLVTGMTERRNSFTIVVGWLAQYTMPVFLMHTIYAAGLRAVLMKLGCDDAVVHVALGITISFVGPIVAAEVMKCIKPLDFLMNPLKYWKLR